MVTRDQALRLQALLREQGRPWVPQPGDRFVIPGADELDDVFVVADMTIEVQDLPSGRIVRFNGTTEWALDSVSADAVLWLPWEHQLRELVGDAFVRLEAVPGPQPGFAVVLDDGSRHVDSDADAAYARALLALGTV